MERVERRGSIARAFGRIRMAMKRRRTKVALAVRNDEPVKETTSVHILHTDPTGFDIASGTHAKESIGPSSNMLANVPTDSVISDPRLEADLIDDNDQEEPLLPMAYNRPGISDNKARDLFSRYGIVYDVETHLSNQERPTKIRRVERPIRLRTYWICHSCNARFGMEKTCPKCGHRKCTQCSRLPPKRVKEVMENGRHMMEQSELLRRKLTESKEGSIKSSTTCTPVASALPSPSLELESGIEPDGELELPPFNYTLYTRPTTAVHMFDPSYRLLRRGQHPQSSSDWPNGSTRTQKQSNGEAPMMKAVQRVYRKPRQRVRYACDHCSTMFVEGDRCRECGHDRCTNCVREPPRRAPTEHDPDILQIVTNRLAAHGGGFGLSQGVTAG